MQTDSQPTHTMPPTTDVTDSSGTTTRGTTRMPDAQASAHQSLVRTSAVISLLAALFGTGLLTVYGVQEARGNATPTRLATPPPPPVDGIAEVEDTDQQAQLAELRAALATAMERIETLEQERRNLSLEQAQRSDERLQQLRRTAERLTMQEQDLRRELAQARAAGAADRQALREQRERAARLADDYAALGARYTDTGLVVTLPAAALRFGSGDAALGETPAELQRVAQVMTQHPDLRLLLVGHSDSVGRAESNLALSTKRAEAVRNALQALGVAPERMRAEGRGAAEPVADNATAEGRGSNRRVEILFQPAVLDG